MTPLHYAARLGYLDVADVLVRYHADVNARDSRGMTALMEACHGGPWKSEPAEEIIQLLLDHNAQVDLIQAAATGRTDLIDSILDRDDTVIDTPDRAAKPRSTMPLRTTASPRSGDWSSAVLTSIGRMPSASRHCTAPRNSAATN